MKEKEKEKEEREKRIESLKNIFQMNKKKVEKKKVIYFIKMGNTDYYKIGITTNIERRLSNLQSGNPMPLHLVSIYHIPKEYNNLAYNIESSLHRKYKRYRLLGEWFNMSYKVAKGVEIDLSDNNNVKTLLDKFNHTYCKDE